MDLPAKLVESLDQNPPLCIGRATLVHSNAYSSSSGFVIQITGMDSIYLTNGSKQPSCLKNNEKIYIIYMQGYKKNY